MAFGQSQSAKSWTYSTILGIAAVASFFLPWFETTSRASFGNQSFSQSLQASPASALIVYIQWLLFSSLCVLLAYKKSRWAVVPAFLNFYPVFSALGLFGKGNSIAYSAYGASVSSSTHPAYGFWIFACTTILFFIATIGELFKDKTKASDIKGTSSVKDGFIQPKVVPQSKRTLEELKQEKELLDTGAISQEDFDQIKHQALGTKPVLAAKTQPHPKEEFKVKENQTVKPVPKGQSIKPDALAEKSFVNIQQKKSTTNFKWIIGGAAVLLIAVASFFVFRSLNTSHGGDLAGETDVHSLVTDEEPSNNSILNFAKSFSGSINNKYKIELSLKNSSGELSGHYQYVGKQTILTFSGSIDPHGNIALTEYDNAGNNTGIFTGQLINGTLQGQWSTPDKHKTYSFIINEIQTEHSVYQLLQGKWQSEDDPKSYKIFEKYVLIDGYEGKVKAKKEEYLLSDECQNDSDKGTVNEKDRNKYISLLKSDMCFHIEHVDGQSLSLVYMSRGNLINYKKVGIKNISSVSSADGFRTTPTGERYKIIKVQVPNHDEEGTTSEIEMIGPVEGIYANGETYISIRYDNNKLLVSSWEGGGKSTDAEGYITSKGLLSFGGQEFDYDRLDESIADVRALTLTNSAGVVFYWYYDH